MIHGSGGSGNGLSDPSSQERAAEKSLSGRVQQRILPADWTEDSREFRIESAFSGEWTHRQHKDF